METIPKPPNPFVDDAGALTVPSFEEWFFLPGDWAIYLASSHVPGAAQTLGLGPEDYGSSLVGLVAWALWVALAIAAIIATSAVRRFDRAATSRIVAAFDELCRYFRMAVAFAKYRHSASRKRVEPTLDVDEQRLSNLEVRLLAMHARLAPGFALTVSDVAAEVSARRHEILPSLDRLTQLRLLQSTVGGLDGEMAYTLTSAGRVVLRLHSPRPRAA